MVISTDEPLAATGVVLRDRNLIQPTLPPPPGARDSRGTGGIVVSGLQVSGCTRQATIARWKYRGNQLVKPLKLMVSKNQQPYGTVFPNAVRSWIQAITADAGASILERKGWFLGSIECFKRAVWAIVTRTLQEHTSDFGGLAGHGET